MQQQGAEPVPGYRLIRRLGCGAYGEVWSARAPGGTLAALKFISFAGKQGLTEWRALQRVKQIRHPNLLPITAWWMLDPEGLVLDCPWGDDGRPAEPGAARETMAPESVRPATLVIAMLLGDKSLQDRLQECRAEGLVGIPPQELLDYMEDAAKGIDFLNSPRHDLGDGPVAIQHCDIKPHNLLLVGTAATVCDFGLAKVLNDVRATRAMTGSPAYMAPECIEGRAPSHATDQYSLALSYYEMRTGRLPFPEASTCSAVLDAHLRGELDFAPLSAAERAVVQRATSVDPTRRYASSTEMVRALRAAMSAAGSDASQSPRRSAGEQHICSTTSAERAWRVGRSGRQTTDVKGGWRQAPRRRLVGTASLLLLAGLLGWGLRIAAPREPAEWKTNRSPRLRNVSRVAATPAAQDALVKPNPSAPGSTKWDDVPQQAPSVPQQAPSVADVPPRPLAREDTAGSSIAGAPAERAMPSISREAVDLHAHQYFLREGVEHLERHRLAAALLAFDQAVRLRPDSFDGYFQRGRARFLAWEYDQALADLDMAISLRPEATEAYLERGRVHGYRQNHEAAADDFSRVIAASPDSALAYLGRGFAQLALRRHDASKSDLDHALVLLDQAIQHDPKDYRAYTYRGMLHAGQARPEQGLADLDEAIRLKPDSVEALENRAHVACFLLNRYDQGISDFSRVILLRPDSGKAYHDRAAAYRTRGDLEKAIADYSMALRLKPAAADVYCARGIAHVLAGDHDAAVADLTEALRLNPQDVTASQWRTKAFAGRGEQATAVVNAEQTVSIQDTHVQQAPDSAFQYWVRANAHEEKGDLQMAIQDYGEVIRRDPRDPYAWSGRGHAQLGLKQFEQAVADYQQAIERLPDFAPFYYMRGLCYQEMGQTEKAQADFAKSAELEKAQQTSAQSPDAAAP